MAFASIFVPNCMVQAVVRADPALRERPLALIDGNPPLCSVVAVNEKAAHVGIECGMTKANAAQFAGVEIRPRSRPQEKTAHAALLDAGWSVSPQIEDTAEDAVVLDLSGLDHLFGSEKEIAAHLVQRSAGCGLQPNVAIALNIEAALLAARGFSGITVIPPGKESESLSNLPVSALPLSEETAETLSRWGVHTCGAFAALPILQISERLGQEGVRLHALARGAESRSLIVAEQESSFEEEMEFDDAVEELDPLSFLLGRLLDQLCARLMARSLAAASIRVRFELQPAFENALDPRKEPALQKRLPAVYETKIEIPVPVRDSKMLLKLLRLRLQSNPPAAPIQKIALAADSARPRAMQGGLFLPCFPEPDKLELTLARIANVVGEGNVGSPSLADTHCPDGFHMERFLFSLEAGKLDDGKKGPFEREERNVFVKTPASFRAFRPPVPAKLDLREERPVRVAFQGVRGSVLAASGPWRTSGDWWRENPWQQEEWDLEIDFLSLMGSDSSANRRPDRGVYRLFYDALRQSWFVRGIYD
ncbi:MAG: DNA polymerase Y family protein [Candidatus Acidiferrales bacterium]